jgi:hypothetical protein
MGSQVRKDCPRLKKFAFPVKLSCHTAEVGKQTCLKVRIKSQIRKFWGSFRYRKSEIFLGVPVRKSQIRKFLQKTTILCLKTDLKVDF